MKKICYIVTLPVTIKAFFIPQLKYLSNKGFEVSVICNEDFELRNELNNEIKFIPVNIPRGISFIDSIKTIKKLVVIFKTEKYDLVQYSTPNAAFYSAIAAKITKIKIRNYHCMGFRYLGFRNITREVFKSIEKITCYLSTHIECVSKTNLELGITEKLFSKDKATVVFNGSTGGVDLKKFNINYRKQWRTELRRKYGIDEKDFVYGFVGRIEELMTFLKSEFDYVIIDTPPAYLFSDAAILAGYADRVLYVVRHDMAEIPQIEKGMESFIQEDKLLGYLINRSQKGFASYGKYGYGKYGYGKYGYGKYGKYQRYVDVKEDDMDTEDSL